VNNFLNAKYSGWVLGQHYATVPYYGVFYGQSAILWLMFENGARGLGLKRSTQRRENQNLIQPIGVLEESAVPLVVARIVPL
jgi:hypothetical protein